MLPWVTSRVRSKRSNLPIPLIVAALRSYTCRHRGDPVGGGSEPLHRHLAAIVGNAAAAFAVYRPGIGFLAIIFSIVGGTVF
jgi:hypothetical protein